MYNTIEGTCFKMLTEVEKSYLAGIIDGEGTICIAFRGKRTHSSKSIMYSLVVSVSNTYEPLIKWVNECFKGSFSTTRKHDLRYKDYYTWQLDGPRSYEFIKIVLPYLLVKHKQALLAIDYWENKSKRTGRRVGRRLTQEEVTFRRDCWIKMSRLNKGGHAKE